MLHYLIAERKEHACRRQTKKNRRVICKN